jgi:SAM-dependent methyltransferase
LDIGCGPGKFCLVAATPTDGHFAGVEQRADLAAAARAAANVLGLTNIEIMHGNVTDIAFADYDAFYLFNPFEENWLTDTRSIPRFRFLRCCSRSITPMLPLSSVSDRLAPGLSHMPVTPMKSRHAMTANPPSFATS